MRRYCGVARAARWDPLSRMPARRPLPRLWLDHQVQCACSEGKRMSNRADSVGEKREIRHITSGLTIGSGHTAMGAFSFLIFSCDAQVRLTISVRGCTGIHIDTCMQLCLGIFLCGRISRANLPWHGHGHGHRLSQGTDCAVLAGARGSRLRKYTKVLSKPANLAAQKQQGTIAARARERPRDRVLPESAPLQPFCASCSFTYATSASWDAPPRP